jgi:hypothetical protein
MQDLVGWDYQVIKAVPETATADIKCVGDFRQTVYRTTIAARLPDQRSGPERDMRWVTPRNRKRRSSSLSPLAGKLGLTALPGSTRGAARRTKRSNGWSLLTNSTIAICTISGTI